MVFDAVTISSGDIEREPQIGFGWIVSVHDYNGAFLEAPLINAVDIVSRADRHDCEDGRDGHGFESAMAMMQIKITTTTRVYAA